MGATPPVPLVGLGLGARSLGSLRAHYDNIVDADIGLARGKGGGRQARMQWALRFMARNEQAISVHVAEGP